LETAAFPEEVMGDEQGSRILVHCYACEEPSAAAGGISCGRPPRADEGNADGSKAILPPRG
jgi:hypothetical protein